MGLNRKVDRMPIGLWLRFYPKNRMPYIYSDASTHPQSRLSVCGFLYENQIYKEVHQGLTNIEAELWAYEMAKGFVASKGLVDMIYVADCQKVISVGQKASLPMMKIEGHKPTKNKIALDKEFSRLDKELRRTLRAFIR